jgi:DNA-binding response OmpR family regulator
MVAETAPHVVVINHDEQLLAFYRELFEDEGYRVSVQTVLDPDLDLIARITPTCIVIDYYWRGDVAQRETLEALLIDERTRTIPVIVCTGATREVERIRERLESSGVTIIAKPFDVGELLAAAERVTRNEPDLVPATTDQPAD